jgi:hypothetical protein
MTEQKFPFFEEDSAASKYCSELVKDLALLELFTTQQGYTCEKLLHKSKAELEKLHTECCHQHKIIEQKYPTLLAIYNLAAFKNMLQLFLKEKIHDETSQQ